MLRAIDEIRPAWVVGENVAGLATMVEGWDPVEVGRRASLFEESDDLHDWVVEQTFTVEKIAQGLEGLGYSVQPVLIPAAAVGAPHRRDRIFVLAHYDPANSDGCNDVRIARENEGSRGEERLQERHEIREFGVSDPLRSSLLEPSPDARRGACKSECNLEGGESRRDGTLCNGSKRASSNADGTGRKESERPGWGENSSQEGARPDDRAQRFGGYGAPSDSLHSRREGEDQPGASEGGERLRIWGDIAGCNREALLPGGRWKYDAVGNWLPAVSPIHRGNDGLPFNVDRLTVSFSRWRTESLKAYGNAIVPQVMYRIFQAIEEASK